MIKKLFTAVSICVFSTISVSAQEIMLDSVSEKSLGGIHTDQHGQFIYIQHLVENPTGNDSNLVVIGIYDIGLMPMKRIEYPVGPTTSVAAMAFNGQFFLTILADPANKTRTTLLIDREGNVMKKKDETGLRLALLQPDSYPDIFTSMTNDFTVIYPIGEKKAGYELIAFDQELEPRVKKSFVPAEGSWIAQDIIMDMEKLYILRKEISASGDKISYSIQQVNSHTGETQSTVDLRGEGNLIMPRYVKLLPGEIMTGGTFTRNDATSAASGLFINRIDASGKSMMHLVPWEMLKQSVKGDISSALASGKTNVFIEDYMLKPNNEGFILIGQAYNRTTDNGSARIKTGDILLFHLNHEGVPQRIDKIEVKPKEAIVKGNVTNESDHAINSWLAGRNFFSYSGFTNIGGQNLIAYTANADNHTKAYFTQIDSIKNDQIQGMDIDRIASLNGETEKNKNQSTSPVIYTYNTRYTPETSQGIIMGRDERAIFYDYQKPKLAIWFHPISAQPR